MHENGKSRSSVEFFCLTIPKKNRGNHFSVSDYMDLEKFLSYHDFSSNFCLTVPKNFVRNHLMFQKFSKVRYREKF